MMSQKEDSQASQTTRKFFHLIEMVAMGFRFGVCFSDSRPMCPTLHTPTKLQLC